MHHADNTMCQLEITRRGDELPPRLDVYFSRAEALKAKRDLASRGIRARLVPIDD